MFELCMMVSLSNLKLNTLVFGIEKQNKHNIISLANIGEYWSAVIRIVHEWLKFYVDMMLNDSSLSYRIKALI